MGVNDIICSPFINFRITDLYLKNEQFTPSLWDAVFFYAFIIAVNDLDLVNKDLDNEHKEQLRTWLRFTRNLIYNTQIQNPENYRDALKQIKYLSQFKFSISENLVQKIQNNSFDKEQFKEEKQKNEIIQKELFTTEEFLSLENHEYFYGQIGFILRVSELVKYSEDDKKWEIESDKKNKFIKYQKIISQLYAGEIRNSEDKILERYLLSIEDYLPKPGSNYIFCNPNADGLRNRNENWRLFFDNKEESKSILDKVVRDLEDNEVNLKILEDKLEDYKPENKNDWRFLFIHHPDAIKYCKNLSAIRKHNENDIRLLKNKEITGSHAELRSYCFYLDHKNPESENDEAPDKFKPFKKFAYQEDRKTDAHPYCYLDDFSRRNRNYKLKIKYDLKTDGNYNLEFFQKNEIDDKTVIDRSGDWAIPGEKEIYTMKFKYDSLENGISELCQFLLNKKGNGG